VAIVASSYLVAEHFRAHELKLARKTVRYADAVLARFSGHPLLKAYMSVAWGQIDLLEGKDEDAVREQERALALKDEALGPMHPDSAVSAMNVGSTLHDLGRDAEAEPFSSRAVEAFQSLLGPESAQVATALLDHAEVLAALGRLPAAREELTRAIGIWRRAGASPFFVAYGEIDLARVALREGHAAEARALLEGAVETVAKEDKVVGAEARFALAETLWATPRDRPRARALAQQAQGELVAAAAPARKVEAVSAWLAGHGAR
jgi:tetratricopeptide (TPR) repeat protein